MRLVTKLVSNCQLYLSDQIEGGRFQINKLLNSMGHTVKQGPLTHILTKRYNYNTVHSLKRRALS